MEDFDPAFSTIAELSRALTDRIVTSLEIAKKVLSRIEKLDPDLNAFVCKTRERAIREATASDARRQKGESLGPLDGVPYAVKDLFDVAGLPTMAGTRLLADNIAKSDCTAVRRLTEAGMVLVGKTHCVMLAFHANGTNPEFGTPRNPWHWKPYIPGGSSSGSAVAVAAGIVPMALGSDTGGSIRVPAALTGTTGFKPTTGRLGRGGVWPLCWSLDAIGPITRTVADAALVFEAMQGNDPFDETTWGTSQICPCRELGQGIEGLHVVICDTLFFEQAHPGIISAVEAVGKTLSELGAKVSRREFPLIDEASRLSWSGTIDTEAYAVNRHLVEHHRSALDPDGLWIDTGNKVSGTDYYYALRERFDLQRRFSDAMGDAHAILAPTSAMPAWPVDQMKGANAPPVSFARNTGVGNYLNWTSISVPAGFTSDGLPIGAMISARPFDDTVALRIAHAYQMATLWHTRRPNDQRLSAARPSS